jgi:hypothetical protein
MYEVTVEWTFGPDHLNRKYIQNFDDRTSLNLSHGQPRKNEEDIAFFFNQTY